MEDIILVDKPKGITSFDVIRRLRRELNIKKMGHSGTLDPQASGLMIIGINQGTKKLNEYIKLDKIYIAEVLLGIRTTTGDLEGEIIEEKKVNTKIEKNKILEVLKGLEGDNELEVPIYSAIKRDGEALYKKARRGEQIELPKKIMKIYWIKLLDTIYPDEKCVLKIELKVSSGTYIRSIAEEIGRRLDYPGTVQELRRTMVGKFRIEDARKI